MATRSARDDLAAILEALKMALDFVEAARKIGSEMDAGDAFTKKHLGQHRNCAKKLLAVKYGIAETLAAYDQLHAASPSVVAADRLPPAEPERP